MSEQSVVSEFHHQVLTLKNRFNDQLCRVRANAAKNCVFLTETSYQKLVDDVKKAKTVARKEPRDYWLLKRYDIIIVENKNKLIFPVKEGVNAIQFYATDTDLFEILHEAHLAIGHGGRDRMLKELSSKYKNITRHDVELYIHLCEPCRKKQKGPKKGAGVKPVGLVEFISRCQVHLIDYQSRPDDDYKFIMIYQDYFTKFMVIRALKSEMADEVAHHLLDIFTLFGAPSILQSDNGREFENKIINKLKECWPTLRIVHGKPRQENVQGVNQDIENMISTWMHDEKTDQWSKGLRFIQLKKNGTYNEEIMRTPYEALFGCKVKVGLTTSSLPDDVLEHVRSEEDLEKIIDNIGTIEQGGDPDDKRDSSPQPTTAEKIVCNVCPKQILYNILYNA